jgi:hypothetical protein
LKPSKTQEKKSLKFLKSRCSSLQEICFRFRIKTEKVPGNEPDSLSVLTSEQVAAIEKYCEIIYSDLNTIEVNGGGSARCMLAEVFFQKIIYLRKN